MFRCHYIVLGAECVERSRVELQVFVWLEAVVMTTAALLSFFFWFFRSSFPNGDSGFTHFSLFPVKVIIISNWGQKMFGWCMTGSDLMRCGVTRPIKPFKHLHFWDLFPGSPVGKKDEGINCWSLFSQQTSEWTWVSGGWNIFSESYVSSVTQDENEKNGFLAILGYMKLYIFLVLQFGFHTFLQIYLFPCKCNLISLRNLNPWIFC